MLSNPIILEVAGGTSINRANQAANSRTVNMYIENISMFGQTLDKIMVRTWGLDKFSFIGNMPCRSYPHMSSKTNVFWIVVGNEFLEIRSDGSFVLIGTLKTNTGTVYMDDNGSHVLIVDGSGTAYIYTIGAGPSGWNGDLAMTVLGYNDPTQQFIGGDHVKYVGGYFFVIQPGTNIIQSCTAPYGTAPTNWMAADVYATALEDAGPLIALGVIAGYLFALGNYSSTVFYNAANPVNFPFSEVPGAQMNIGIGARASLCVINGTLRFLAKTKETDRFIAKISGIAAGWARISTTSLEQALKSYTTVSDADFFAWNDEGHVFMQCNFTAGNQSWLYDDTSPGEWCERSSYGLGMHRTFGLIQFNGKQITGDRTIGMVYWQHPDKHTDNGDPIIWTRRFPMAGIKNKLDPITINELRIYCQCGTGLQAGPPDKMVQGQDPQIAMKYSWNGGQDWTDEQTESVGKIGEQNTLVRFSGLGSGNNWQFELSGSDPVPWSIFKAYADVS